MGKEENKFSDYMAFRKSHMQWLGENKILYSLNHPTNTNDNIDFAYEGVRVRCFLENSLVAYQLNQEVFDKHCGISVISFMFFKREELHAKLKRFKLFLKIIRLIKYWF